MNLILFKISPISVLHFSPIVFLLPFISKYYLLSEGSARMSDNTAKCNKCVNWKGLYVMLELKVHLTPNFFFG